MTHPTGPSPGDRRPRRLPTLGDGSAPVMTLTMLGAAAIAVIVGLVVLHSITSDPAGGGEAVSAAATTTVTSAPAPPTSAAPSTTTTTTAATTTTVAPGASKSDAVVMVANASGVNHSATAMTAELAAAGYSTAPVANSTGPRLERSVIYYLDGNPASLGVARLLAAQLPTAEVLPMPQPPPLDRPLNRATVALLLGRDAAGQPLTQVQSG